MSTFTKQFVNVDEYEEWLLQVGDRISVLSITNPAGQPVFKPRKLWMKGARNPSEVSSTSSGVQPAREITVKYQTSDKTLAPATSTSALALQVAIVGVVFFAVFVYAILKF